MTDTMTPASARPEAPVRRRTSLPPSRWRRAGALIVGAALAVAAVGLQSLGLDHEERTAHLTWTGSVGDKVAASRFSARVKAIHTAETMEITALGGTTHEVTTSGILLIADVEATANRKPQKFSAPILLAEDGKRYTATDKVAGSLTITNLHIQAGWWVEGVTVFDIPVTALAGSRIVLAPQNGFMGEALLPEVEIDLGLDEAAAQRLISNAKDVYQLAIKQ